MTQRNKTELARAQESAIEITTMSGLVFQGVITEITEFYVLMFDNLDNWVYEIDFSDMQKVVITCS